jgi:hypothetical protein
MFLLNLILGHLKLQRAVHGPVFYFLWEWGAQPMIRAASRIAFHLTVGEHAYREGANRPTRFHSGGLSIMQNAKWGRGSRRAKDLRGKSSTKPVDSDGVPGCLPSLYSFKSPRIMSVKMLKRESQILLFRHQTRTEPKPRRLRPQVSPCYWGVRQVFKVVGDWKVA